MAITEIPCWTWSTDKPNNFLVKYCMKQWLELKTQAHQNFLMMSRNFGCRQYIFKCACIIQSFSYYFLRILFSWNTSHDFFLFSGSFFLILLARLHSILNIKKPIPIWVNEHWVCHFVKQSCVLWHISTDNIRSRIFKNQRFKSLHQISWLLR